MTRLSRSVHCIARNNAALVRRVGVPCLLAACLLTVLTVVPRPQAAVPLLSTATLQCGDYTAANALPPMPADDISMVRELFRYLTRPHPAACGKRLQLGGQARVTVDGKSHLDGHKWACVDPEFSLTTSQECLVYSAGINNDWTFDWAAEALGCEVVALDPSINGSGSGGGAVHFYRYGLAGADSDDARGWRLRTLDTLVRALNHTGRTIQYLKMDVEGTEWGVIEQQARLGGHSVLANQVQQLAAELHLTNFLPVMLHTDFYRKQYETLYRLQEMGFYPFSYEPNLSSQVERVEIPGGGLEAVDAFEVAWVKTRCVERSGLWYASGGGGSAGFIRAPRQ